MGCFERDQSASPGASPLLHFQSPGTGSSEHQLIVEGVIEKATVWADLCSAVR